MKKRESDAILKQALKAFRYSQKVTDRVVEHRLGIIARKRRHLKTILELSK